MSWSTLLTVSSLGAVACAVLLVCVFCCARRAAAASAKANKGRRHIFGVKRAGYHHHHHHKVSGRCVCVCVRFFLAGVGLWVQLRHMLLYSGSLICTSGWHNQVQLGSDLQVSTVGL